MKFTLELNAYELREAIRTGLLDAVACLEVQETVEKEEPIPKTEPSAVPEAPAAMPETVPMQPQQPVPQAAMPPQPVPVQPPQDPAAAQAMQAAPTAVPVQAVSYTTEQLGLAAMQVADSKGHQVIEGLLQRFGVAALTQLAKEQYGAFAAELRILGAIL